MSQPQVSPPAAPPAERPRQDPTSRATGTDTVVVGCKVPNGLILELVTQIEAQEPMPGGGMRRFKMNQRTGERFRINGPGTPFGMSPKAPVHGGYALTFGVPSSFFEKWLAQNAQSELVKNKQVFACSDRDRAQHTAEDMEEIRSGLEPLAQAKDPRVGSLIQPFDKAN